MGRQDVKVHNGGGKMYLPHNYTRIARLLILVLIVILVHCTATDPQRNKKMLGVQSHYSRIARAKWAGRAGWRITVTGPLDSSHHQFLVLSDTLGTTLDNHQVETLVLGHECTARQVQLPCIRAHL